jgi:glycogen debranching enzyme
MVAEAWAFTGPPSGSGLADATVTLVDGTSFCISAPTGDIDPGTSQGLFYRDTRFLSCWQLRVNDAVVQPLSIIPHDPFSATFVAKVRPPDGRADSTLLVVRRRFVGNGMREDLVIQNMAQKPAVTLVTLTADVDFAHVFDVKDGRPSRHNEKTVGTSLSSMTFSFSSPELSRSLELRVTGEAKVSAGSVNFEVVVPAKGEWSTCLELRLSMDQDQVEPQYLCNQPVEHSVAAARLRAWKHSTPRFVSANEGFQQALGQGQADLGSLRIFDPEDPTLTVVAAGAPWFMALFGRDSLITSWMTLVVDPSLAIGTLLTLARFQGEEVEPASEEEPGRILHEMRWGMTPSQSRQPGDIYYGSIDSTPLFVMLLGELRRWGLEDELLNRILPHADRALSWIETYGDKDGDGFVEYERASERGLVNQGWKDSWDGINFANGRVAEAPIALCEVQGYVYAAYVARSQLAHEAGDTATSRLYREKAARLKVAFNKAFWLADRGYFAIGLDRHKTPIDSLTSNIGHCLWTGIVDRDKAAQVAGHLASPEMSTGWGVRTLASSMGAYNPVSYHNGSVWPHDTAIVAAGLMRYGFVAEAQRIIVDLLRTAQAFQGRLPELVCGFDRKDFEVPIGYPTSCSPQAWAAAAPFSMLRSLLRLDPSMSDQKLSLAPVVPRELGDLRVRDIPFGGSRLDIEVASDKTTVDGLPPGVRLSRQPRES